MQGREPTARAAPPLGDAKTTSDPVTLLQMFIENAGDAPAEAAAPQDPPAVEGLPQMVAQGLSPLEPIAN